MKISEERLKIGDLVKAFREGFLCVNREYQRGLRWNYMQRQLFLDSVFRGYPIPPLFLHRRTIVGFRNAESVHMEIVDGQQRLIALREFFDNTMTLLPRDDPRLVIPDSLRQHEAPWGGKRYADLGDSLRTSLEGKEISVFELQEVEDDEVRDLFLRLQAGTPLTRQERRDAWPGMLGNFIVSLAGRRKAGKCTLFRLVDNRGQGAEDEERDEYVKDRTYCAQTLVIFHARFMDPSAYPATTSRALDDLYHKQTAFDDQSVLASTFQDILKTAEQVFDIIRTRHNKRKISIHWIHCVVMLLQDYRRNPQIRLSHQIQLATAINTVLDTMREEKLTFPRGPSGLQQRYECFREQLGAHYSPVTLDPRRAFSEEQQQQIQQQQLDETGEPICAVCHRPMGNDQGEYDHFPIPYRDGGRTIPSNGRLVHYRCHPRGRPIQDDG